MALTQRLDLRQSQTLVMTPQLQQAIKLLQLSNIELEAFVELEIERNPLLERPEGGVGDGAGGDGAGDGGAEAGGDGGPGDGGPGDGGLGEGGLGEGGLGEGGQGDGQGDPWEGGDSFDVVASERLPQDAAAGLDTEPDNVFGEDGPSDGAAQGGSGDRLAEGSWKGGGGDFDGEERGLDQTLAAGTTLRDHLMEQIQVDLPDPRDRLIALQLIDMLDDSGYLIGDLGELAERLGCTLEAVEAVLARLQSCDPPGLFARSLAECLALQLKEKNRLDPMMERLLGHLDVLARRDVAALMRICGCDREDLQDMVAEIRALDPKPALAFEPVAPQEVPLPDILMRMGPDGSWLVELNPDTLPRVLVNNAYYARVSRGPIRKQDKEYLSECFQSANWLVKSLHQRAGTILKVATEIVRQQDGFFAHGVRHLRPLVLRDIADAIGMHESTVSRVTTNKFINTPRGLFELKYFFTAAIQGAAGGASHSAEAVRHRVKSLIDAEGDDVLSDDKIVEILLADGIDIARRTVAKYRESLKIPSSVQRRRDKATRL